MSDKQDIRKNKKSKPATKDDNINIVAIDINQIVKKGEKPRLKVTNSTIVHGISSMDLDEGVTIKAIQGGNPNKNREER